MKTWYKWLIAIIVLVFLIILSILIVLSVSHIDYHEMGFKRSRTTGEVNTDRVYTSGRYLLGPSYEFKKFKASAHYVHFATDVFTSDRLEMEISVSFQYFLRPHQLKELHATYDIVYERILIANALSALKNAAPGHAIRQYIRNRQQAEELLQKAVTDSLGGRCCLLNCSTPNNPPCKTDCKPYDTCILDDWGQFADVRFFQLGGIGVPTKLRNRFHQTLILQEAEEREQYLQNAVIVRKETSKKAKIIENLANVIQQAAYANRTLLLRRAQSESNLLQENARRDGLKAMYNDLNITSSAKRSAFDYLRTLRKSHFKRLAIDYTHLVAKAS